MTTKPKMISGPQRKFCEGIVAGLNQTAAYQAAYPRASYGAARAKAAVLAAKDSIKAEIARLRAKADEKAGSAVMTLAEKRAFLARVVRTPIGEIRETSDLCQEKTETVGAESTTVKLRMPDKLAAIKLDNDLAGEGSEAGANDALTELLERVMK